MLKDLMVASIMGMKKQMVRDFQPFRHTSKWMIMNLRRQKINGNKDYKDYNTI